jgi:CubicO group peptidase (beta-lactamase class C family)
MKLSFAVVLLVPILVAQPINAFEDPVTSAESESTAPLAGLWRASRDFGPEVRGTLDLTLDEGAREARIGGFTAPVRIEGGQVRFEIAGDRGAFRASLEKLKLSDAKEIRGHWIQPPTAANFVRFASPVVLSRLEPGHWRGEVRPLPDRMTFYLSLEPRKDGSLGGFLRNPEANFGRHFQIEGVRQDGEQIAFEEPGFDRPRLQGPFHRDEGTFSLYIPDAGGTFDFRRVTDVEASSFRPRPGFPGRYTYRPPAPRNDGWPIASLTDAGIDVATVERMIQAILDTPADAIDAPYFHAVLIARHGKLVLEEYFHGFTADQPHDTRSASKTVISTLIGLALQQGAPLGLDSTVYSVMAGGESPPDLDPRKQRLTLRHLLTMTPGLACDDNDESSPGAEWVMQSQPSDWVGYTLDLPMAHEPGEHVAYCSASTNLAGAVLTTATDSWLPDLFQRHFATPLGVGTYHMNLMPDGEAYGGGGLHITGRDFLKMGQLFLDGGNWNGRRLLSEDWVRDAASPIEHMFEQGYGYAWWVIDFPFRERTVQAYYAGGNGGQYVMAIPELDLTLVFFAGNYNQRETHLPKKDQIPNYILKAVASEPAD